MAEFIGIEISNVEKLYLALAELPAQLVDVGSDAVLDYWRGVLRNPANYAPWRYVSRAAAYPDSVNSPGWKRTPLVKPIPGFFSLAQFLYVKRLFDNGYQPGASNRTGTLAKSWQKEGKGETAFLYNAAPYASYVIGTGSQSRHEKLVGWLESNQTLNQPAFVKGAERALVQAVDKAIKKKVGK